MKKQNDMKKLMGVLTLAGIISFSYSRAQSKPDKATYNFIIQATIGGLQEVNSGKLAAKKALRPDVKAFGERMVRDHGKANAQLAELVKSRGYQIPPQVNAVAPDKMLATTTGARFDSNYVDMMAADHQKTVSLFQNYAVNGTDPDIRGFAQQTLPIIKSHLAAIKAIADKMKTGPK